MPNSNLQRKVRELALSERAQEVTDLLEAMINEISDIRTLLPDAFTLEARGAVVRYLMEILASFKRLRNTTNERHESDDDS